MVERSIDIEIGNGVLPGDLTVPEGARALVLFAHGSGSSRKSPRNRHVASVLNGKGLATFLFDLLTAEEDKIDMVTGNLRFDIDLLGGRLGKATDRISEEPEAGGMEKGYFGASTGAAAALRAADGRPEIKAIVSRGGRPDLAGDSLLRVASPTLLIVGGNDPAVIEMNREAASRMTAVNEIRVVPGAGHLFEEPGRLDAVAELASRWFERYLKRG